MGTCAPSLMILAIEVLLLFDWLDADRRTYMQTDVHLRCLNTSIRFDYSSLISSVSNLFCLQNPRCKFDLEKQQAFTSHHWEHMCQVWWSSPYKNWFYLIHKLLKDGQMHCTTPYWTSYQRYIGHEAIRDFLDKLSEIY